ncbi:MAG: hypothetical protein MI864_15835 [Pseudomonadales bacterium]|nr:hypothetical protein [Pseudomonadales bacterium]
MELIMVCVAAFVFFFGSAIATRAMDFGFHVGDKAVEVSGTLAKLPFKLIFFAGKYLIKRLMKNKPEEVVIKPFFAVTPLELQQMRNRNLLQSGKRQPIQIEHPPQQSE